MKRFQLSLAAALAAAFAIGCIGALVDGCGGAGVASDIAGASYTAKQVSCEQEAGSRAQAMVCRCGVDNQFGVDGGNCARIVSVPPDPAPVKKEAGQ